MLMLQALTYAQSTGWVVLYLPSGQLSRLLVQTPSLTLLSLTATPILNSSTPHVYSSSQALFGQPALALQLLGKFTSANKAAFKALKTRKAWTFGDRVMKIGTGLDELSTKNVDEKTSTAILEALFDELAAQQT